MFFHLLASLFHLFDLLFVTRFFGFALFPLFVGDTSHNFHRVFGFFLLFINLTLVMSFDLFLVCISLLLNQTLLEPMLESFVAFFLLDLLMKSLLLFLPQLMLLFECLRDKFALLPLVHEMGTILVFLIKSCLLNDHFLKKILLGFEHEYLSESLLMLFEAEPGVVIDLFRGDLVLVFSVHIKK